MRRFIYVVFVILFGAGSVQAASSNIVISNADKRLTLAEPLLMPSQPGNLRLDVYSADALEIFWDRSVYTGRIEGYSITRNGVLLDTRDALSYFDNQIDTQQPLSYEVRAIGVDGTTSNAAMVSINTDDGTGPGPDANLLPGLRFSVYSPNAIELFWNRPPADSGITGYEIRRDGEMAKETDGISFFDDTLLPDTGYRYDIRPILADGTKLEAASISVNTSNTAPTGGSVVVPANLSGAVYSDTSLELFWDRPPASAGVVAYEISRDGVVLKQTDGISFYDDALLAATAYTYTVRSIIADGTKSEPASVVIATTGLSPAPANLSAEVYSDSTLELFWDRIDSPAVTSYTVFRDGQEIATTDGTSYYDTGLSPATVYSYSVAANTAEQQSDQSRQVTVETLMGLPVDPPVDPPIDPPVEPSAADTIDGPFDIVLEVDAEAPYGTQSFDVPAETNWVNTGLYLNAGEIATISASGSWMLKGESLGPDGSEALGSDRGCALGTLVVRSGLLYEDEISCIGTGATYTAPRSDIVYMAMHVSSDLNEAYEDRLAAEGFLSVTLSSDGSTVPSVRASEFESYDLSAVSSGWIEILGEHVRITTTTEQAGIDSSTVVASVKMLDDIYKEQRDLRSAAPFNGQRIRFFADDSSGYYMLAGNPIRANSLVFSGEEDLRILRVGEQQSDGRRFAHEFGHSFGNVNGMWVYQIVNIEAFPNIFMLYSLNNLGRFEILDSDNPYCRDRSAYLSDGEYSTFRDDAFLQLCFFMEFTDQYGWDFWKRFYANLNVLRNGDIAYDGGDASVWRFLRDQFTLASGEDATPAFERWFVPLE